MATQPDNTHNKSHVVAIDVDAAGEPKRCCVCTEPLKWVAVGQCGHRDVCGGCATRIRFFLHDRRCCICRTDCPTVLVTRADTGGARRSRPRLLCGLYHWYDDGTGAYFDDWHQYMAMVRVCMRPSSLSASGGTTAGGPTPSGPRSAPPLQLGRRDLGARLRPPSEDDDDECQPVTCFVIYLCAIMILVVMFGLFFKVSDHFYQKVIIVVAFGVLSALVTIVAIWTWRKYTAGS